MAKGRKVGAMRQASVKISNQPKTIDSANVDDTTLRNVVKAVPARGVFDISDASGNALYAPSKVRSAVRVLIQDGFVAYADAGANYTDVHATYRLTEKGIKFQKEI